MSYSCTDTIGCKFQLTAKSDKMHSQLATYDDRAMSIEYTRGRVGLKFTCYIVYIEVIRYNKYQIIGR